MSIYQEISTKNQSLEVENKNLKYVITKLENALQSLKENQDQVLQKSTQEKQELLSQLEQEKQKE